MSLQPLAAVPTTLADSAVKLAVNIDTGKFAPVLQIYEAAPLAVMVIVAPGQILPVGADIVTVGRGMLETVNV